MLREGEPGEALRRFWRYQDAAALMVKTKRLLHSRDSSLREWAEHAMPEIEDVLDDAWGEVGRLDELYDGLSSHIVATHFLFGYSWEETAAMYQIGIDKAKKLAYAAIRWLDASKEAEEEEDED